MAETEAAPVQVSLEDLGPTPSEAVIDDGVQYDLGNLLAFDPSPIDPENFTSNTEEACQSVAGSITRSLVSRLCALPSHSDKEGRILELPEASTSLPRQKPIPKPKPLTRWQKFAQMKGIKKRKKDKLVWDEENSEWRRRYGYKRVGDTKDVAVLPAKATDQVGDDPFSKMQDDKKTRVKNQRKREQANARSGVNKGHVPATVKLTKKLPDHGKGNPMDRKGLKDELRFASLNAGVSTASIGKFDSVVRGEQPGERVHISKKRKLISTGVAPAREREVLSKMADKMIREKSDEILDVGRAIGKMEAEKRAKRHTEKVSEELDGGRKGRGNRKGSRKNKGRR